MGAGDWSRRLDRRENREGNGGWTDGAKHEERARSYKGVVINGNTGQQNRGRDSKEYYGKGKGKMGEAPDSKWVKVPERGNRRPYNHYGNYRGHIHCNEERIRGCSRMYLR
ncbi:hypothetical protein DY000_02055849 [Brassica cretica]|uniref:Uncharacterized protein n=1 Tax=Brassica cretica TaxID=69181 RepID=A0ABQ7ADU8_BRACR|nr:hypothetical protein DY000_02055849 [Brassica cretica]